MSAPLPFIMKFTDSGSVRYVYNGISIDLSPDEIESVKKMTSQNQDELDANAFIMLTKQHPLEEIIAASELEAMIKRGSFNAEDIQSKIS